MNISSVYSNQWINKGLVKPPVQANLAGTNAAMNASGTTDNSTATQFMNFMKLSPEEQMQNAWLAQHGITKAQFDAMSPADKQKILAQIENEIKQKAQEAAAGKATQVPTMNILA